MNLFWRNIWEKLY